MQSILRALGVLVYNDSFAEQLDVTTGEEPSLFPPPPTKNEFLIPFQNGMLDMEFGVLRRGRPEDLVMRGPMHGAGPPLALGPHCERSDYLWQDFGPHDPAVIGMEAMLNTLFPDRSVRDFMLTMGASLLRKRNRYKHFYVLTLRRRRDTKALLPRPSWATRMEASPCSCPS